MDVPKDAKILEVILGSLLLVIYQQIASVGPNFRCAGSLEAPENSIAFGKSTLQRIHPEQHTPKIGWKLHKYGLQHALHTLDDHFR